MRDDMQSLKEEIKEVRTGYRDCEKEKELLMNEIYVLREKDLEVQRKLNLCRRDNPDCAFDRRNGGTH